VKKIPPGERIRKDIDELLQEVRAYILLGRVPHGEELL
jgi:hypothetical protein